MFKAYRGVGPKGVPVDREIMSEHSFSVIYPTPGHRPSLRATRQVG